MFQNKFFLRNIFGLSVIFLALQFAHSQTLPTKTDFTTLELNKPFVRSIANSSEIQTFQIFLNKNQFAKITIDQNESDLTAQLFAPDDITMTTFDGEPRLNQKEEIKFVAAKAGNYRLEVKAKYQNSAGRYEIKAGEILEATDRDRALFEAYVLCKKTEEFDLTGKYNEALVAATRALEIAGQQLPADDALIGFVLTRLGAAQRRKGDYATAETTLLYALATNEKILGPEHPQTVDTMRYLVDISCD